MTFTLVPPSKGCQVRNGNHKWRVNRDRRSSGLIRLIFRLSITRICDYWLLEFLWVWFEIIWIFYKLFHDWVFSQFTTPNLLSGSRQCSGHIPKKEIFKVDFHYIWQSCDSGSLASIKLRWCHCFVIIVMMIVIVGWLMNRNYLHMNFTFTLVLTSNWY